MGNIVVNVAKKLIRKDTIPLEREKPPTFSECYRIKSNDRISKYAKRKKNVQKEKSRGGDKCFTFIACERNISSRRGSRLPVSTNVNWSPSELKRAIFNKLRL